jgi:hypothetical protein
MKGNLHGPNADSVLLLPLIIWQVWAAAASRVAEA